METLLNIDTACFHFINTALSNPVFDFIMPLFHHTKSFILFLLFPWILAIVFDKPNRWKLACIIPIVIILTDQTGLFIKKTILRPRPFVELDVIQFVKESGLRKSFPSNHAANSAALATVFSMIYPHLRFILWGLAITVMFSPEIPIAVTSPSTLFGEVVHPQTINAPTNEPLDFSPNRLSPRYVQDRQII